MTTLNLTAEHPADRRRIQALRDFTDTAHSTLATATRRAYRQLEAGGDSDAIYEDLASTYEGLGLDSDTAESSIDWLEGGTLSDDLTDALARRNA